MRVGQAIKRVEKYHNNPEFRKKRAELRKRHYEENKEYYKRKSKEWSKRLAEFKNNHCKVCNKLLDYRTKGKYCFKHKYLKGGENAKKKKKHKKKCDKKS